MTNDEDRTPSGARRCTAKSKTTGGRCSANAMRGQDVCAQHGGKSPQARAAAQRRVLALEVEAEARAVLAYEGTHSVEDPLETLARITSEVLAFKDALARRVNALDRIRFEDAKGGEQLRAEVALYERALDRSGKFLEILAKSGIEERRMKLDEQQAQMFFDLIQRILADLGLTAEQQARVPEVAQRHLRAVAGGAA